MNFKVALTQFIKDNLEVDAFWLTTPESYDPTRPFIIAQRVGGRAHWYLDKTPLDSTNSRIKLSIHAKREIDKEQLTLKLEDALYASDFVVEMVGAPIDDYDFVTKHYISHMHFAFWHPRQ